MYFWDYCGIFDIVLLIISRLLHQAGVFCLSVTIVAYLMLFYSLFQGYYIRQVSCIFLGLLWHIWFCSTHYFKVITSGRCLLSFWDYCGIFDIVLLIISRLLHQAGVFCLSGTIVAYLILFYSLFQGYYIRQVSCVFLGLLWHI